MVEFFVFFILGGLVLIGCLYLLTTILQMGSMFYGWRAQSAAKTFVSDVLPVIRSEAMDLIDRICLEHADALSRKRTQLCYMDDYRKLVTEAWEREKDYFFDRVVLSDNGMIAKISTLQSRLSPEHFTAEVEAIRNHLYVVAERVARSHSYTPTEDIHALTGNEFEVAVEQYLTERGWMVVRTGRSGDQGVDLVAEKAGTRIALQCKRYSGPVGNAAVQEAFSGQQHYQADFAVVVTNQSYTRAARQLAATTKVRLLHYSELDQLDALIA